MAPPKANCQVEWVSLPIPSRRGHRDQEDGPSLGRHRQASAVPLHLFLQKTLECMVAISKDL